MDSSRRHFLTTGITALAGTLLPNRDSVRGMAVVRRELPSGRMARRTAVGTWLPDPPSVEQFRALALVAMDVARQDGADYADIRIGLQRDIIPPNVTMALGYGIRARVAGTWGFQHGSLFTDDAIRAAARAAVASARTAAAINATLGLTALVTLAPTPVVTGEWHSAAEIDPFSVTIDDYRRLRGSLRLAVSRLGFVTCDERIAWRQETRVFASTDGSLVTQSFTRGGLQLTIAANLPENFGDAVWLAVPTFEWKSTGFEEALRPDLPTHVAATVEDAIRWRSLPVRQFDALGRYPVVFDGMTMASVVGQTASLALEGDRVAGYELDASGGSFVSPVSMTSDTQAAPFSPVLTITSGREAPSATSVQWDDDGVVPDRYTLVERGRVVDYYTTRETAAFLSDWYHRHGVSLRSHGCSVASTPVSLPVGSPGDVHVAPSAARATVDDLAREIGHGFLVLGGAWVTASPRLTNGLLRGELVIEVSRGQPTARLRNVAMAFSTKGLLQQGLVALGDSSTVRTADVITQKGMPWRELRHPMTAPAALCKDVDVTRADAIV